jgi:hypothetical protein
MTTIRGVKTGDPIRSASLLLRPISNTGEPMRNVARLKMGLQRMSIVASEPLPTNAKLHIQVDELRPEVSMVEWQTVAVSPPLTTLLKDETLHPVDQEFGIGVQFNPCSAWNRAKSFYRREKFPSQKSWPRDTRRTSPVAYSLGSGLRPIRRDRDCRSPSHP